MSEDSELPRILSLLPVLVSVAQTGSITAAAHELGVPQPTASRALSRLSALAGVPLTRREGRGIVLTDAGARLADVAQTGMAVIRSGLTEVRHGLEPTETRVAVSFQTLLGERYIPEVLRRFRQSWPQAHFDFQHGSRALCIETVADGSADVAVIADPPVRAGTYTVPLFSEPLRAIVHHGHPLAGRPSVTVDELRGFDLIMLTQGYGLRESVLRLLTVDGVAPAAAFEVGDYRTARGLASADLGVTILPPSPTYIEDGVREIAIDDPLAKRDIGALVAETPNPAVPEFIAALRLAAPRYGSRTG